jgi:putative ubiquitin-RnfH superfamily antitoxin RatB of RatAB toxin-antitoxin module
MAETASLAVSVVLAEPSRQQVVELQVPSGTTAAQAIERSGLLAVGGGLEKGGWGLAIYGRLVEASQVLAAGDRVEILRPLPQDPKTRRRELARRGLTVGKSSAGGRGD